MDIVVKIIEELRSKGLTVSTAESCTGGLAASAFVDITGASDVYMGGFVTYSNELKESCLGVSHNTLKLFGAVSEQTAKEMAAGCALRAGTDVSIATTGIAGPGGGSKDKPVGLVYISCALRGRVEVRELRLDGDRTQIRRAAVKEALRLLEAMLSESQAMS